MGKTDTVLDIMGERLDHAPAPMIYVGPNREFNTDIFEPRLMQLLDGTPTLASKVTRGRKMKKTKKTVAGVSVRLAHAGSATALKSEPAALAILDEYDGMLDIKGQGDPLGLVKARGHTYANFSLGVISTPTLGAVDVTSGKLKFWKIADADDIQSPIWKLWQTGTRYHWCWKCPQCEDYFIPRFDCLKWSGKEPAEANRTAHVQCPNCGGVIEQSEKAVLNKTGVYVAPGQSVDSKGNVTGNPPDSNTLSYWVSGLCSPFTTFGKCAEEYLTMVNLKDPVKIQTVINSKFGELFTPRMLMDAPKYEKVAEHRSPYYKGDLPEGVMHLVVTVDVQKNGLYYVARGWGARNSSWLMDWGYIFGETVYDEVWDTLADYITNPICGVLPRICLVDSGFRPGKVDQIPLNRVYMFARQFPRLVRCTKGSSTVMTVPIRASRFDVKTNAKAAKYGLDILRLDTDYFKSWVHERLNWPVDQLGSWLLPEDVDDDYMQQMISESRTRLPSGKAVWVQHSKDNHYFDCEAMQAAGAHLLNFSQIPATAKRKVRLPPAHMVPNRTAASRLAK